MKYKTLLIISIVTAIMISGCGKKTPKVPATKIGKNNISDANQIMGETVTIDQNAFGNKNGDNSNNNVGNADITGSGQDKANAGLYNSSLDGFKSIYFGFGAYGISSYMQTRMVENTTNAKGKSKIKIEGNCDEFGTDEYNYALGLKRAKVVKDYMISQGVSASKMLLISYGESNPICTSSSDDCYAQNRRVDLRLVR